MFTTGDRSSPVTPVRASSLHSMINAASNAPPTSCVIWMPPTSGNVCRNTGGVAAGQRRPRRMAASRSLGGCGPIVGRLIGGSFGLGLVTLDGDFVFAVDHGVDHFGALDGAR